MRRIEERRRDIGDWQNVIRLRVLKEAEVLMGNVVDAACWALIRRLRGRLRPCWRADARREGGGTLCERAASLCKRVSCIRIICRLNDWAHTRL